MMNHTTKEIGVRSNGYQACGPAIAPQVSEIDREMQGIDNKLNYLEERLSILQRRLHPVVVQLDCGLACKGEIDPSVSTELGGQLRAYSVRAVSLADRVDYLLENLALA